MLKRITDEEIEKLSRSFYDKYQGQGLSPSEVMELHHSEYWDLIFAKQFQADRESIKASREKIAIFLEEHDGLEFTFEWKADQIIKLLLGEE